MYSLYMKRVRFLIGLLLVIFIGFVAFGLFSMPKVNDFDNQGFSAERVAQHIKVISQEPHSVEHPQARGKVRDYLVQESVKFGCEPELLTFDSIEFRYGNYFYTIDDIYCKLDPVGGEASSYVMLIAHYDSRFRQSKLGKTVYSYGASDDAYGVGVILELVDQALKYRSDWKQGVKILFTDSEENGLDGIKAAYKNRKDVFEDVGFVINLEARGVKGPALLFETSGGNEKLMDLYSEAKMPYGYSLTTVVYRMLPNFTDFTVVKEDIPGINFSTIDNINYYHVDEDNFSNINLRSIQHYGTQITPILKEYLTSSEYASPQALTGEDDDLFFTLPLLGMFRFSKGQYSLLCAMIFAVFCLALVFNVVSRNATLGGVLKKSLVIFIFSLLALGIGEGIAYLSARFAGADFNLTDTRFVKYAGHISVISVVVMGLIYLFVHLKKRKSSPNFAVETLLGASLVALVLSIVLFFAIGENFFLAIPLFLTSLALIFHIFIYLNVLSLPLLLIVALLGLSFLYVLSVAITIGALGVIMFLAIFYIIMVVGLFDCYMNQQRI